MSANHDPSRRPSDPLLNDTEGHVALLLGNEAIVRGALESGIAFACGYPGTPSSEVTDGFARIAEARGIRFEYSINEKIALEPLEALRALGEMSGATKVVVNMATIAAPKLARDGLEYPELLGILEALRSGAGEVLEVDGNAIVRAVGVPRALNFAMLGAAAGLGVLPFGDEVLLGAISRRSAAAELAANRLAFSLGREAVKA